jgi:ADP-ribose pyrophosphatase
MDKTYSDIPWKKIQEKIVFQNNFITLFNDVIEKPDKKRMDYLKIQSRDFSTVFCETKENKVVLIRQYRYPFGKFSWEFPGGMIDDGENPSECAKREVLEETGYKVLKIEQKLKSHPNANSNAWGYSFLATVEKKTEQKLDESEFILVKEFERNEVKQLIVNGDFIHGPSLLCWLIGTSKF